MVANQHFDSVRVRVFHFVPEGNGTFADVLSSDFTGSYRDICAHVAEVFANLPAHHFAVVCDAMPNAAISLGYGEQPTEMGAGESPKGFGVDTASQGLAREQKAIGRGAGPGKHTPSWVVAHDGEHSEIPADLQTGKSG